MGDSIVAIFGKYNLPEYLLPIFLEHYLKRNIFISVHFCSWYVGTQRMLVICASSIPTCHFTPLTVLKWFGYLLRYQPSECTKCWKSNCSQYLKQASCGNLCKRKSFGMEEKRILFSFLLRVYLNLFTFFKVNIHVLVKSFMNSNTCIGSCACAHHRVQNKSSASPKNSCMLSCNRSLPHPVNLGNL